MPIKGLAKHNARLRAITGKKMEEAVGKALQVAAEEMVSHANHLITQGSASGKGHVPSSPGEPPNNDTSHLRGNIDWEVTGPLSVEISSNAPYAAPLEFGTSKMAPRPYMAPTRDAKRGRAQELVQQAVNHVVKTSGG